jgi:hypothetical protein
MPGSGLEPGPGSEAPFPPPHLRGVPQPTVSPKDFVIILFMLGLWAYSIHLILRQILPALCILLTLPRAWNKILSDGSSEYRPEGTGALWWR